MSFRDTQIVISRQSVLLVTGVGVGLLTLAYVLGVQVGKQSAALRRPAVRTVEDELKSLPEPLLDQLKIFEAAEAAPAEGKAKVDAPAPEAGKKVDASAKPNGPPAELRPVPLPDAKAEPKPKSAKAEDKPAKPEDAAKPQAEPKGTFNLQLVATPDPKEAARVTAKAKAAGYATTIIQDGKLLKIRLAKPLPKADADIAATKLMEKGLKPFVTKAD